MAQAAPSFRIGGPAAASLLVNGLLIAALLNLGLGHGGRRPESPPLTVLSLALLKGAEQGDETAEAPHPPAAPADTQTALPAPTPPAPTPVKTFKTLYHIQNLPAAVTSPVQPAVGANNPSSMSMSVSQTAPSTVPSAAPLPRRGAIDGLDVKAPAGTSRSYAAKVRSWLYAHKIYPRRARMRRQEGQVRVRFVLDRAGLLLEGAIIDGSGIAALDDEATAMMRRASPYPQAPVDVPGERIEFTVPIDFIMPA
jgi:protein TonB